MPEKVHSSFPYLVCARTVLLAERGHLTRVGVSVHQTVYQHKLACLLRGCLERKAGQPVSR